ncbi:unnamed protein product, partial [Timema podura]|nr:unnamed protein product [Timema podura]
MITLLALPDVVLDEVFSFLTYDETAQLRVVCKQFNNICKKRLNKGFILAEKFENKCLKSMKSQLPRRESERRNHPLARHCDILSAIETRISMMSMTFNKYIETDLSCFIPGK